MNNRSLLFIFSIAALGAAFVAWFFWGVNPLARKGQLSVAAIPQLSNLTVFVDDKPHGKIERWQTPENGMFTLQLPVGKHTVLIAKESSSYKWNSKPTEVTIREDDPKFLELPITHEFLGNSRRMINVAMNYRSDKSRPADFVVDPAGFVTDKRTGLQWQTCTVGQQWDGKTCTGTAIKLEWDKAQEYPKDHSFAGKSDWRVPTIYELQTLVYCSSNEDSGLSDSGRLRSCERNYGDERTEEDFRYKKPTLVQSAFPNSISDSYWSSDAEGNSAEYVLFEHGVTSDRLKNTERYVRLVRSD